MWPGDTQLNLSRDMVYLMVCTCIQTSMRAWPSKRFLLINSPTYLAPERDSSIMLTKAERLLVWNQHRHIRVFIKLFFIYTNLNVITWKRLRHYWPFMRGIQRSPMDFPHKGLVGRTFDILFDVRLSDPLNKHLSCRWFETPWLSCDVTIMY